MVKKFFIFVFFSLASMFMYAQKKKVSVAPATHKVNVAAGLPASLKRGKAVYATYCLSCHQADGGGVPNLNPPLIQTSYVLGDKYALIKIVLNGFQDRIDIDGESFSNNMPPLKSLKDQQIADVLTYIRNNFGNKASAINAQDVQKARK